MDVICLMWLQVVISTCQRTCEGFVQNAPVFHSVVMESTSLSLCCYGIHPSFTRLLWNPPIFHSVTLEATCLSFGYYGIHLPFTGYYGIHPSFTQLLWNPPIFHSVTMESTSLSLRYEGIYQSFTLFLWNPPVFHSVTRESTSLSLCYYALACRPNNAASLQVFHAEYCLCYNDEDNSFSPAPNKVPQNIALLLCRTNCQT